MTKPTEPTEKDYSQKDRDAMPDSDFAGPHQSFPVRTQDDVHNAARLIGHADDPEAVKAKIIAIAKRKGFSLPDAWQDKTKESVSPALASGRVATLTTCFLEDDAISMNGRKYPREAVDRLIQSAQIQLSTPGAKPLTCYISHDAADHDDSLKLVGKITNVWREGTRAMASIDIANTSAGRDAAALALDQYLVTQSLRASNAELRREKDSTWPVVGGKSLTLEGIDFTATPGIQVARIQNVALAESSEPQPLHEVFNAHSTFVEVEQKETPMKIDEADQGGNTVGGYSPTSGNSTGMTSDPTKDSYGSRMYHSPDMTSGPMQGMDKSGNAIELQEAHDRIALVQNRSCAPARESARWKMAFAGLEESERKLVESGRSLSSKNDSHLDIAHNALAKHLAMECEGKQNKVAPQPADDGLQDGDSDDKQSHRPTGGLKESRPMTEEEALKLLEARGYDIAKPKTETEQLREQLDAQQKEIAEMRAHFTQKPPTPQRKSGVLGANVGTTQPARANVYQPGKYLKEQIAGADWSMLADRTAPLPDDIDLSLLIREFTDMRVIQNFDRYGWPENLANATDRL